MADKGTKTESAGKRDTGKSSWQERKLEKVVRDDIDIISRKTRDQSDFISMLNTHDNVLYQLRMNMGRNRNLTFDKAQEFIERSLRIKDEINLLNAEMCQLMNWEYRPPRGFTNPLAAAEQGKRAKGGSDLPVDISDQINSSAA